MARTGCTLRASAVLAAGALGVHQARYVAGFGEDAPSALAGQGHGYLAAWVMPAVGVLLAAVLAQLLARSLGPARTPPPAPARFRVLWMRSALALLAIYVTQELIEGALVHTHPAGVEAGLVGHHGWVALPLTIAFGAIVAVALRSARAIEAAPAHAPLALRLRFSWPAAWVPGAAPNMAPAGAELADHLAGRGPPVLCR